MIPALIMALMPYHVVVTRQVLLDGPMVFCATLTLYLLARIRNHTTANLVLCRRGGDGSDDSGQRDQHCADRRHLRLFGAVARDPASPARSGDCRSSAWRWLSQHFRSRSAWLAVAQPSRQAITSSGSCSGDQITSGTFYPSTVPFAIGLLVIAAALLGFWLLRSERSWREKFLIWWILVPVVFFQLWPTKGFQYLLPTAPAFAILAGQNARAAAGIRVSS